MGLLFQLLFVFVWVKRLFWLLSLPIRLVMEPFHDFKKLLGLISKPFRSSSSSSPPYPLAFDDERPPVGKRIVWGVLLLILGFGTLLLVAGIHRAVSARGGEAGAASPAPPGNIGKNDGRQPEVRRAIAVPAQGKPSPLPNGSLASSRLPNTSYVVAGVAEKDALNVRSSPGANNKVIARLANGYGGIQIVGPPVMNDQTPWVQIRFKDRTGWVTPAYLQPR